MVQHGDYDLGFVRRQLDDLTLSRSMGVMTTYDGERYTDLCERERALLAWTARPGADPDRTVTDCAAGPQRVLSSHR